MRKTFVLLVLLGLTASSQPPVGQLPPGVLGGPIRAPAPPVPGDHAGRLGPRVVPDGDGGYREDHIAFTGKIDRDGAIRFEDKLSLDITDALIRLHGEDPYRYEKAKLMERTREERAGMAVAERTDRLHGAVARMPAYLEKVWTHTAWPAAQRRVALFALWQEVAEDGADEVVSTGRMVRATIAAFIRRRLPEGSRDAFTREEIEALNRGRTCTARFEPYR